MLLTADIGNTNIVLALLDHGDRVVSQRRIPSGEVLPLAAYEDAVRQVLAGHDAPEGAVIGSVVPRLTEEKERLYQKYSEVKKELADYGIIKQNVDSILRVMPHQERTQEL